MRTTRGSTSQRRVKTTSGGSAGHEGRRVAEDEPEHQREDDDDGQPHTRQTNLGQPVRGVDERDLLPLSNSSRCAATGATTSAGERGHRDRDEEQRAQRRVQIREPLLERQGQQEARQDLDPGLGDAELLQQLVPVAVRALGGGLVALRSVGVGTVGDARRLRALVVVHGQDLPSAGLP